MIPDDSQTASRSHLDQFNLALDAGDWQSAIELARKAAPAQEYEDTRDWSDALLRLASFREPTHGVLVALWKHVLPFDRLYKLAAKLQEISRDYKRVGRFADAIRWLQAAKTIDLEYLQHTRKSELDDDARRGVDREIQERDHEYERDMADLLEDAGSDKAAALRFQLWRSALKRATTCSAKDQERAISDAWYGAWQLWETNSKADPDEVIAMLRETLRTMETLCPTVDTLQYAEFKSALIDVLRRRHGLSCEVLAGQTWLREWLARHADAPDTFSNDIQRVVLQIDMLRFPEHLSFGAAPSMFLFGDERLPARHRYCHDLINLVIEKALGVRHVTARASFHADVEAVRQGREVPVSPESSELYAACVRFFGVGDPKALGVVARAAFGIQQEREKWGTPAAELVGEAGVWLALRGHCVEAMTLLDDLNTWATSTDVWLPRAEFLNQLGIFRARIAIAVCKSDPSIGEIVAAMLEASNARDAHRMLEQGLICYNEHDPEPDAWPGTPVHRFWEVKKELTALELSAPAWRVQHEQAKKSVAIAAQAVRDAADEQEQIEADKVLMAAHLDLAFVEDSEKTCSKTLSSLRDERTQLGQQLLPRHDPCSLEDLRRVLQPGEAVFHLGLGAAVIVGALVCKEPPAQCWVLSDRSDTSDCLSEIATLIAHGLDPRTEHAWNACTSARSAKKYYGQDDPEVVRVLEEAQARFAAIAEGKQVGDGAEPLPLSSLRVLARCILQTLLPQEVRDAIRGLSRITLVPAEDCFLHQLPLSLIAKLAEDPVFDGVEVVQIVSATALVQQRAKRSTELTSRTVVLGDPIFDIATTTASPNTDKSRAESSSNVRSELLRGAAQRLPFSAFEAKAIAELNERTGTRTDLLLRDDATFTNLVPLCRNARYVHFSTHACLGSSSSPLDAAVLLTPREEQPDCLTLGHLVAGQVSLSGVELVVTSVCHSSPGLVALPLGLMAAGARAVLATTWRIHDLPSAMLMERFWQNMTGQYSSGERTHRGKPYATGQAMPPLAALEEAQQFIQRLTIKELQAWLQGVDVDLETLRLVEEEFVRAARRRKSNRPFEHPRYWGAWVFIGDPVSGTQMV